MTEESQVVRQPQLTKGKARAVAKCQLAYLNELNQHKDDKKEEENDKVKEAKKMMKIVMEMGLRKKKIVETWLNSVLYWEKLEENEENENENEKHEKIHEQNEMNKEKKRKAGEKEALTC